ncbi:related to endochitinase [Rhynchosporium agropyri]|uniref:chitinase n=1 Tax=Rhynchosporium agropyri TaxID=914238 RepID=A0A1E1KLH5_9HELO|nr:related to endochitinase [Rhynchosporium agropyri]
MVSAVSSFRRLALFGLLTLTSLTRAAPTYNTSSIEENRLEIRSGVTSTGYRHVSYFVNWGVYGRNYHPAQLPYMQLTHVAHAFAKLSPDGTVLLSDEGADLKRRYPNDNDYDNGHNVYGVAKQLYLLKKKNRNLKTLLSIGGHSLSANFAVVASNAESREKFAATAVNLMQDLGQDGLDVDWEFPQDSNEASNYVLLLAAVRAALDAYSVTHANGHHFSLTVASPAGPQKYGMLQMAAMDKYLDAWHLMTYDYAGQWDVEGGFSGHAANLYPSLENPKSTPFSTDRAVSDYLKMGVTANKIVVGIPLYGRGFQNTDGLGMPFSGTVAGSWDNDVWDYKELPKPGATMMVDAKSGAAYSYDAAKKELVSFDTPEMARTKAQYTKDHGLAGIMYWENSGDKCDADSIVGTVRDALGELEQSMNCLSYPNSQYANMAAGMPGE